MRAVHCMRFLRRCERVELPLEVATLDVVVPLTLTLDGDAAIFASTTVVELGLEVSHSDARCWYTQRGWRMCS
jgi:hypothetical protein